MGAAEAGIVSVGSAIGSAIAPAVETALERFKVRIADLPIKPVKLPERIDKGREADALATVTKTRAA